MHIQEQRVVLTGVFVLHAQMSERLQMLEQAISTTPVPCVEAGGDPSAQWDEAALARSARARTWDGGRTSESSNMGRAASAGLSVRRSSASMRAALGSFR
jgi:hypothetical protein